MRKDLKTGFRKDTPQLTQFQVTQFHTYAVYKKVRKQIRNICEKRAEFFPEEIKAQRDESRVRLLLGGNKSGGAVALRTTRFQCPGVWMPSGLTDISGWEHLFLLISYLEIPDHNYG